MKPRLVAVDSLPEQHRRALKKAVSNVLETDIAEETLAQVVDGLPISKVEFDRYGDATVSSLHPLHDHHTELCAGALPRLRELSKNFNIGALEFDAQVMHAFSSAAPGSKAYHTRLVDVVARSIHQIAVSIHQSESGFHKGDHITTWAPSAEERQKMTLGWTHPPSGPPTFFVHRWYTNYNEYPNRVADGVGYWAEARILGGVVLFDRRDPEVEPEANPNDIYFHSDRYGVTYRIYRLLDEQKQSLIAFLKCDETSAMVCPLPVLGTNENRKRFDSEEPVLRTGIYRDPWERKEISPEEDIRRSRRRVFDRNNYANKEEWSAAISRSRKMEDEWFARHYSESS